MKILNKKQKKTSDVAIGTLYDVNKSLVEKNVKELAKEELEEKKQLVIDFIEQNNNNYYMLLCNDQKDYTIFSIGHKPIDNVINNAANILIDECLYNRGVTKSIELTETKDAIEI